MNDANPNAALDVLTPREREYVLLLALGKSRKVIALMMGVAVATVGYYHCITSAKLGVKAREFHAWAVLQGWHA